MHTPHKTKATPRRVDLINNAEDYRCVLLGAQGFSTRFIMERTRLSACQITYRLARGAVRRCDYRNGHSPVAKALLKASQTTVDKLMAQHLEQQAALFSARHNTQP